ncbi:AraC family transcriptional regulator [Azospirillum sp. SYSU D00513]|uniref:AraC family transcriptional regulator n=1 Tax=Azospirillum sp. SYSU D00513 TaxID=2812561 RepID=UPI001A9693A5|nr:AraC family transcriptional regulator [Azospirillum sp. SYSU D00513]
MDDALTRLAQLMRVHPRLDLLCRFAEDWAVPHEPEPEGEAPFHIVTRGRCMVDLPGLERSLLLEAGDILVLPHGHRHVLRGEGTDARRAGSFTFGQSHNGAVTVRGNAGGLSDREPDCELICGRLRFEQWRDNALLGALPDTLHLGTAQDPALARLERLVETMRAELEEARPGAGAIAADLASALFTMLVRAHVEQEREVGGVLALLGNRTTARALLLMLEDPARGWTLDGLASASNASRAGLVRAFRKQGNIAPLALLTQLRLQLAARQLTATELPVSEVAARVGYEAEEAFSRAFKRHFGASPSAFRLERAEDPALAEP